VYPFRVFSHPVYVTDNYVKPLGAGIEILFGVLTTLPANERDNVDGRAVDIRSQSA
jgi:hypothetical protein